MVIMSILEISKKANAKISIKKKKMKIQLISRLEYLFQKEIENITEGIDICRIISSISMIIICLNLMKRMKKYFDKNICSKKEHKGNRSFF